MKCLNLIRRHGKTLLPLLAFLALPIFSLGFSSESASAAEMTVTDFSLINHKTLVSSSLYSGHSDDFLDFVPTYVSFTFSSSGTTSSATSCYSLFDYYTYMTKSSSSNLNYSSLCLPTSFDSSITYYFPLYFASFLDSSNNFQHRYVEYHGWSFLSSITFYDYNPLSSSPPSGSLSITANGTYDVSSYAEAVVEVPDTETIIQGDYHDDLVDIKNIALVAIAVALFICFGRLILGMFMGLRR